MRDVWIVTVSSAIGVRIVMENESGLGNGRKIDRLTFQTEPKGKN